ncbi:rho GTPase-activating protein 27-like isoform 2-T2 [Lycaon pictus]
MAMAADVEGDVYVLVEHPFEYTGKDGRRVAIQPNERYRLLRRSTEHWWHVRCEPGGRPFYLPAQYVRELPALGDPAASSPPPALRPGPAAPEPLAYDYRFVSAPAPAGPDGTAAKPRGRVSSLCGPARRGASTQHGSPGPGLPTCLYTRPAAPVRPAQSLDDLARAAVAPPAGLLGSAGSFKACSVAGSWVCPRPLARSDSGNVYEAILDERGPARDERPQQPPTPETDYPESLTSYPEEDYSPVGSLSEPRPTSPLAAPPGWSCHVSPEGQTLYTNHYTQEQWVRLEDQHGKPYFYNPEDTSVQWELPQVPVPAPRSICRSNQDSETPAQASPPEEKIKTLDKAGVLHRTKTVDKGKRLRKEAAAPRPRQRRSTGVPPGRCWRVAS